MIPKNVVARKVNRPKRRSLKSFNPLLESCGGGYITKHLELVPQGSYGEAGEENTES